MSTFSRLPLSAPFVHSYLASFTRCPASWLGRFITSVQDIREVYNFICTNYVDRDEIILIGFSRGAFTARSVADMVATLGLLTPDGLDHFFAVFEDYEALGNEHRDITAFLVHSLEPWSGQVGKEKERWESRRQELYRKGLEEMGYTRDTFKDGTTEITIKALGVWDTVGTLGIPPAPVVGIRGSADQWAFTNTQVSNKVENAFQALALDEPRYAFRPALWERVDGNKTNLKQVWFPGTHCNVGGGWWDQGVADITLACKSYPFPSLLGPKHLDCGVRPTTMP